MRRIAALLTCHNRKDKTEKCLDSLRISCKNLPQDITLTIYLVDDGSTDGTSEMIRQKFPDVILIQGTSALYWNRGMHLAWSIAAKKDYDYYLWLNDDTIIKENALSILVSDLEYHSNHGIICGVCESSITSEITYGGYTEENHQLIQPNGNTQQCFFFNGNVVLIPKSVYKVLGNLDPVFHHGFGDFDYGLRARKKKIGTFISSKTVACCEDGGLPRWCNPDYSLRQRLKVFYTPLGCTPFQHFIYTKRHFGFLKAFKNIFSNHLRLIFPSKWITQNNM